MRLRAGVVLFFPAFSVSERRLPVQFVSHRIIVLLNHLPDWILEQAPATCKIGYTLVCVLIIFCLAIDAQQRAGGV